MSNSQVPTFTLDAVADAKTDSGTVQPKPRTRRLTAICPRPIPNSYWAKPLLLACEYPWTPTNPQKPKLDQLLRAGICTFIDLTESGELSTYSSVLFERAMLLGIDPTTIEYHQFPIRDRCLPESIEFVYAVMSVLRDNEDRGRISAVHCRGGIGRTGLVVGCWLVESGDAENGEEALAIIAREWKYVEKCTRYPHSPETGAQAEFVRNFAASPKRASWLGDTSCRLASRSMFLECPGSGMSPSV